jgi:hypothetical protein
VDGAPPVSGTRNDNNNYHDHDHINKSIIYLKKYNTLNALHTSHHLILIN